jgi:hypothetical protein
LELAPALDAGAAALVAEHPARSMAAMAPTDSAKVFTVLLEPMLQSFCRSGKFIPRCVSQAAR